ncbi:unnamed protein product [Musa banksii]
MADPTAAGRRVGGTEHSWCRGVPGGTGVLVLGFFLSRPVPRPLLESALHRLQTSHPLLRSRLNTAGPDQPFFSIAHSPSLTVRPLSASDILQSQPASPSHFHALLEHELNENPWSSPAPSHPILFATAYDDMPEAGRTVVALRFHSAACDRTSAAAILKELLRLIAGSTKEEEEEEEEGFHRAMEDLIPKQDAWKPFWARGKDLVGYSLNGLRTSTLPFEDAGSDRRSEVVRLVLGVDDTQKLLNACKVREIKLCGAMSAAALVATNSSKHLEKDRAETYTVVTLIDCRKYLDPVLHDHSIGSYHSAVINTHNVHGGEELWEVAERCHESYSNAVHNKKHLKDITEINFLLCKAIDNPQLTPSSSQRTALISVFEEPVVYDSSELQQELGVEDYIWCASVHGAGPSIAVFDTIRDGRLDCAFVYPSPLHSRKQMQELVEHMKTILTQGSLNGGD